MEQNLAEAKKRYANRRAFALKLIALFSVGSIIVTNFNKVVPNNYFTCEIRAIKTYFEQIKINPKIAAISYHILSTRCDIGDYR